MTDSIVLCAFFFPGMLLTCHAEKLRPLYIRHFPGGIVFFFFCCFLQWSTERIMCLHLNVSLASFHIIGLHVIKMVFHGETKSHCSFCVHNSINFDSLDPRPSAEMQLQTITEPPSCYTNDCCCTKILPELQIHHLLSAQFSCNLTYFSLFSMLLLSTKTISDEANSKWHNLRFQMDLLGSVSGLLDFFLVLKNMNFRY